MVGWKILIKTKKIDLNNRNTVKYSDYRLKIHNNGGLQ